MAFLLPCRKLCCNLFVGIRFNFDWKSQALIREILIEWTPGDVVCSTCILGATTSPKSFEYLYKYSTVQTFIHFFMTNIHSLIVGLSYVQDKSIIEYSGLELPL